MESCLVLQPCCGFYSAHCLLMQKGDYEAQQGPLYDLSSASVPSYLADPEGAMLYSPQPQTQSKLMQSGLRYVAAPATLSYICTALAYMQPPGMLLCPVCSLTPSHCLCINSIKWGHVSA